MRLFGFLTLVFSLAWAQGSIEVESKIDRSEMLIGDVIQYSILVKHDPDIQVKELPMAANLGQFEIRDYTVHDPEKSNGKIIERIDYQISTFDTGEYTIPPVAIRYTVDQDSVVKSIKTEPLTITVNSLNPDQAGEIRDIKPPLAPAPNYKNLILLIVGIVLILLITIGIYIVLRRRKQGKPLFPQRTEPPRPPHEVALEALYQLQQSDLLATGQVKAFYSELSEILRVYIEGRTFIDALEMTTREMLAALHEQMADEEAIERLREVSETADLVKFAKFMPTESTHNRSMSLAFEFIERTRLFAEPEQEDAKQDDVQIQNEEEA
jgi:hypothetical protein